MGICCFLSFKDENSKGVPTHYCRGSDFELGPYKSIVEEGGRNGGREGGEGGGESEEANPINRYLCFRG